MDLKSHKHIRIGMDLKKSILCQTNEVSYYLYSEKELNELSDFIKNTLDFYKENGLNDGIIEVLNKQSDKEYTEFIKKQTCFSSKIKENKSGLYLISIGEKFLKIGKTKSIDSRIKTLKIGNPYDLKVLFYINGLGKCESFIHKLFDKFHVESEWFNYDDEIISGFNILEENKEVLCSLNGKIDLDYYINKIFKK